MPTRLEEMDAIYSSLRARHVRVDKLLAANDPRADDELQGLMIEATTLAVNLLVPVAATMITAGSRNTALVFVRDFAGDVMAKAVASSIEALANETIHNAMRGASPTGTAKG